MEHAVSKTEGDACPNADRRCGAFPSAHSNAQCTLCPYLHGGLTLSLNASGRPRMLVLVMFSNHIASIPSSSN